MTTSDATRLAGAAYSTRLALNVSSTPVDKTRIAQEGDESRLGRDAAIAQPAADESYKIGEKIGARYEVSAIHHGAMGVVYGCFDHITKLPRALKTVRARYASDKQVLSMFEAEAAVWVSLEKHPYIVRAYLVERFKDLPYVITEYVRGPEGMEGDLRGWLGHPRLTLAAAVTMALQIAQGMQHAVMKVPNLVHRDLKPANILVNGDGKAMVTDFGLVQAAEASAGTPAYMSPEQWRGEELDVRSDIYAFGCILFEMITAHRLFPASTPDDWEHAHLDSRPAPLISLVSDIPAEIDQFVRSCLEKDSGLRPQSWDAVVVFFAQQYCQLTGKAVVLDFSSIALDSEELFVAGYSLMNLNRNQEALEVFDRALKIDPNDFASWYNKGKLFRELKRPVEALYAYDQVLGIFPKLGRALLGKGNTLGDLKRFEESIDFFDQAILIDPNDVVAWYNKANSLEKLKRYDETIQALDHALTLNPSYADAWNNKGSALQNLKRYEEAILAFDQTLRIEPADSVAWFNRGLALESLKCYEQANESYDRALAIDPNFSWAWSNKGNSLHNLKSYDQAIQAFDRALLISPTLASAWNRKGNSLLSAGRYIDAVQSFDRAFAIDRKLVMALVSKARALTLLKRFEESVQAHACALAIAPNLSIAWYGNGNALMGLDRYDEANQSYDRAVAIDSKFGIAWYNKGNALFKLARYPEAVAAYDRVLEINPSGEYALRGRQQAIDALGTAG